MPGRPLSFLGHPITDVVALSSATGNVTVAFAVLSYAGRLTITVVADPDTCPDMSALRGLVEEELHVLTSAEGSRLVVLGTRGLDAYARALFGSTSREVPRRSPVTVLVVNPDTVGTAPDEQAPSGVHSTQLDRLHDHSVLF